MLHIKFQASVPSGSEEEDFLKFLLCIYTVQTWDSQAWAILDPGTFAQTWSRPTRQRYIPNFKHLSKVVLKETIFKCLLYVCL